MNKEMFNQYINDRFIEILYKRKNTVLKFWTWPEFAVDIYQIQWPPTRKESEFMQILQSQ